MGQINTNNYPTVDSLADTDLLIVENATHGTGTTTPKQLRENAIGTDPLQTTAQTVTGAINELKNSSGGDSYALVGMGQVTSYSNKVADTNVYLHRAPKEGDRLFIKFQPTITDSDAQIKIYDQYSGTAYTLSFNFWASGSKLAGLCLLEVQDNGFGTLGLTLKYSFEGGTNYTAGAGIEINGSTISNTAPNYGVDVDGATISSVSSGYLGNYVGESKYLILYFSASASPYSGGYTLTLSSSGSVSIQEYGTLYDGSSRYNSNISAGTMLLCEVTDTGTGSSADPVHVNIIGKIDPNSGGGNTVSKTRYQISSSSWSSSANSDGYYTATKTLSPTIGSSPDVYVAGSADGTQPTDTEKNQFAYVKRCKVNGSTLTLYASSKPSSTFYIWVEGVNGTGSGDIVGNVIQPNGDASGDSYYVDYQFGASTLAPTQDNLAKFDAGTIGTRGAQCSISLASEYNKGYVPVSVTILTTTDSSAYIPFVMLYNANQKVVLNLYRATTSAVASAYTQVRVLFKSAQS